MIKKKSTFYRMKIFLFSAFLFLAITGVRPLFFCPMVCAGPGDGLSADGTLGTVATQTGNTFNITGGTTQGGNLFHSFTHFNLAAEQIANFQGAAGIENIISRVTGGNNSLIAGTLKSSIADANLYLINPYGVIFGANASVDISGSFYISSADYLNLSDGGVFYNDTASASTLTSAPVESFMFLGSGKGSIVSVGDVASLVVGSGQTFAIEKYYEALSDNIEEIRSALGGISSDDGGGDGGGGDQTKKKKKKKVAGALSGSGPDVADAGKWRPAPCSQKTGEDVIRLMVSGRDASPTAFDDFLPGFATLLRTGVLKPDENPSRNGYLNLWETDEEPFFENSSETIECSDCDKMGTGN